MPRPVSLSYTMAKRYERCGELARQWREKLIKEEVDQRPFFVGRVVHLCFEWWLAAQGTVPIESFLPTAWAQEESTAAAKLPWVWGERDPAYARAAELLPVLGRDASVLAKHPHQSELDIRADIIPGRIAMYAKPDALAWPSADVLYVVELKSGVSFDPKQIDWYAAVIALQRKAAGLPWLRQVGVSLRPALEPSVETRDITAEQMMAQARRANDIAERMWRGEYEATPQGFCSRCEGRDLCPVYQRDFGRLATSGRVGL